MLAAPLTSWPFSLNTLSLSWNKLTEFWIWVLSASFRSTTQSIESGDRQLAFEKDVSNREPCVSIMTDVLKKKSVLWRYIGCHCGPLPKMLDAWLWYLESNEGMTYKSLMQKRLLTFLSHMLVLGQWLQSTEGRDGQNNFHSLGGRQQ